MELSVAGFFASFLVSTIGFSVFLYGKKQVRTPPLVIGIVMMVFPYFISAPAFVYGIGGALLAGLWFATRLGW